jgi:hypothetical protein
MLLSQTFLIPLNKIFLFQKHFSILLFTLVLKNAVLFSPVKPYRYKIDLLTYPIPLPIYLTPFTKSELSLGDGRKQEPKPY